MIRGRIAGTIRIEPLIEPLIERAPARPRRGDATLDDLLASFAHCEHLAAAADEAPQQFVACRVSRERAIEPADAFARADLAALVEELEAEFSECAAAAGL